MPQVLRAPLAEQDLTEIWCHIAKDNVAAADRIIDMIVEKCRTLATHPEMGQSRPELAPQLRGFSAGNFVILYRPFRDGIEVARVVHAARDVDALF